MSQWFRNGNTELTSKAGLWVSGSRMAIQSWHQKLDYESVVPEWQYRADIRSWTMSQWFQNGNTKLTSEARLWVSGSRMAIQSWHQKQDYESVVPEWQYRADIRSWTMSQWFQNGNTKLTSEARLWVSGSRMAIQSWHQKQDYESVVPEWQYRADIRSWTMSQWFQNGNTELTSEAGLWASGSGMAIQSWHQKLDYESVVPEWQYRADIRS